MLGFRVRFELLKQVKFPGPKFTDNCGMNTFTNMALKTRTWCYSFDQYIRKCNDRLVVNMINKNCIVFPDSVASTVLLLLCETSCPLQQQEQGLPAAFPDSGSPTQSYAAAAAGGVCCWCCSPVLMLLWFGNTYAHKSCTSDLWVQGIHTMSRETPSRLRSKQALTSTASQCQSRLWETQLSTHPKAAGIHRDTSKVLGRPLRRRLSERPSCKIRLSMSLARAPLGMFVSCLGNRRDHSGRRRQ